MGLMAFFMPIVGPLVLSNMPIDDAVVTAEVNTSNVQIVSPNLQTLIDQSVKDFRAEFKQNVRAGDRSSEWYKCFSRKEKGEGLVTYNPAIVPKLRKSNFENINWNLPPIIVVDGGHGHSTSRNNSAIDIGASRGGVREVDVVDAVMQPFVDDLKSRGFLVAQTRETLDESVTITRNHFYAEHPAALQIRAETATALRKKFPNHPIIFVSLHADVSNDVAKSGAVAFTYAQEFGMKALSSESVSLAKSISTTFSLHANTPTRRQTEDFAVLRCQNSAAPSVLLEMGFLSNVDDSQKFKAAINNRKIADDMANDIASGIERFVQQKRGPAIQVAQAAP